MESLICKSYFLLLLVNAKREKEKRREKRERKKAKERKEKEKQEKKGKVEESHRKFLTEERRSDTYSRDVSQKSLGVEPMPNLMELTTMIE